MEKKVLYKYFASISRSVVDAVLSYSGVIDTVTSLHCEIYRDANCIKCPKVYDGIVWQQCKKPVAIKLADIKNLSVLEIYMLPKYSKSPDYIGYQTVAKTSRYLSVNNGIAGRVDFYDLIGIVTATTSQGAFTVYVELLIPVLNPSVESIILADVRVHSGNNNDIYLITKDTVHISDFVRTYA